MLKRLAILLLMVAFTPVVHSAEWSWIGEKDGYRIEIDKESIVKEGDIAEAWDRVTPPGGLARDASGFYYRYVLTWSNYNCSHPNMSIRKRIYVGEEALQSKEVDLVLHPDLPIKSGTPREKIWAAACGKSSLPAIASVSDNNNQANMRMPKMKSAKSTASKKRKLASSESSTPVIIPLAVVEEPQLLPNRKGLEKMPVAPVVKPQPKVKPVPVPDFIKIPERRVGPVLTEGIGPGSITKTKPKQLASKKTVSKRAGSKNKRRKSSILLPMEAVDCIQCIICASKCKIPDNSAASELAASDATSQKKESLSSSVSEKK